MLNVAHCRFECLDTVGRAAGRVSSLNTCYSRGSVLRGLAWSEGISEVGPVKN